MNLPAEITLFSRTSKQKFTFTPKSSVNLYLCGPTVYGDVHIGNMRASLFFDLLIKLFSLYNIKFTYYQNITDIDDKIIDQAQKSQQTEAVIAQRYFLNYQHLLRRLGFNLNNIRFAKITDYIGAIVDFIKQLFQKQFAYQIKDGIYFDTAKLSNYSFLTANTVLNCQGHMSPKADQVCCLQQFKEQGRDTCTVQSFLKKNCADFALWKLKHIGQTWDSPWGKGRPGWHTECVGLIDSLFSKKQSIGQTTLPLLNIHGGGSDLIVPHHHNELAQFAALFPNQKMVDCWWHNGLVHFCDQKISKSQSTTTSLWLVKNFLAKYNVNILKFLLYSEIYESDLYINEDKIQKIILLDRKICASLKKVQLMWFLHKGIIFTPTNNYDVELWTKLLSFLNNGLRTHLILDHIQILVKQINILLEVKNFNKVVKFVATLFEIFKLLGMDYQLIEMNASLRTLISDWNKAVIAKNFTKADQLRCQLQQKGFFA